MEIVQSNEAFKTVAGKFQFQYVAGIVRNGGVLYTAKWVDRKQKPSDFSQLYDVQPLKTEDRGPAVSPTWVVGPADNCFVKTPSLFGYASKSDLERRILREVETCETLRDHPHRNIASYLGYRETRGRVSGLCFKRYTSTLLERVNPGHLNKSAFRSSRRPSIDKKLESSLAGILEGIRHLHSLGLAHNDINPANIMFDEDDTPVLIDFDSCRRFGESLRDTETKRTHGWHDTKVEVALAKNDLDAFLELQTWFFGSSSDEFLLKG
ncbi:kinase-like domain-containing protein [Durotheca rogersii]|uniref:kinase-like domain-containing protein n=1 Tax=Durotheca rogersii TaxID=419775 RepID=UPI002220002A|nr:kinase-like domain-containing protein [Durotheca rogersii]KAI5856668.1 kinase-like domain-containing protein [Durotheca rogersii]